ncbi:hypothetical protein B9479_007020 [Cryptococcus floricola]|uniref:Aminotransferase class I/classII large domain-containing protein n=1 Tax=Cryptococcus floricola TaxID=2591691 RepID=A0A5D3ANC0_9TREE|nr:hypothetical protein B9479_007020 [Cryptococcus floricola]
MSAVISESLTTTLADASRYPNTDDTKDQPDNDTHVNAFGSSDQPGFTTFSIRATTGPDAGPLIDLYSRLFHNQYDAVNNPGGIVSLGVAENLMMQKECFEIFTKALKNMTPLDLSYGDSLWGSRRLNKALSEFINDRFSPAMEIKPEHIITGTGASAVLDQLFFTLLDEGDAVLLAAPYYTGFDRDLVSRGKVTLIPVYLPPKDLFSPEGLELFNAKYEKQTKNGLNHSAKKTITKVVCNPQNPLGRPYPRATLLAYAKFCEERDLHLVSDEIYAMSVYENKKYPDALPFTSFLSLNFDKELSGMTFDKARLHGKFLETSISKLSSPQQPIATPRLKPTTSLSSFCANGFRIGALISPSNPHLLLTMAKTSSLMRISSPSDVIWSCLLNDKATLQAFIDKNRERLAEAQAFVRGWFEGRGVVVADSNAGNFVWINLGQRLGFTDVQTEKQVFHKLLHSGVYIAPGTANYHHNEAGWYRVTFTVARQDLVTGLDRMERILGLTLIKS